jgi:hypothetical protein
VGVRSPEKRAIQPSEVAKAATEIAKIATWRTRSNPWKSQATKRDRQDRHIMTPPTQQVAIGLKDEFWNLVLSEVSQGAILFRTDQSVNYFLQLGW